MNSFKKLEFYITFTLCYNTFILYYMDRNNLTFILYLSYIKSRINFNYFERQPYVSSPRWNASRKYEEEQYSVRYPKF